MFCQVPADTWKIVLVDLIENGKTYTRSNICPEELQTTKITSKILCF